MQHICWKEVRTLCRQKISMPTICSGNSLCYHYMYVCHCRVSEQWWIEPVESQQRELAAGQQHELTFHQPPAAGSRPGTILHHEVWQPAQHWCVRQQGGLGHLTHQWEETQQSLPGPVACTVTEHICQCSTRDCYIWHLHSKTNNKT